MSSESLTRRASAIEGTPEELHGRLSALVGCPLPFYLNAEYQPCATLARGATPHRVIVLSIPKAGTYFLAEVLREWGCAPTSLHLARDIAWDYRQRTLEEIRSDSFRYQVDVSISQSAALVQRGQFAVGHLECVPEVQSALTGFRKIFIYRDLRDALISQMRFLVDSPSTVDNVGGWKQLPKGPERMIGFLGDARDMSYMFSLFRDMRAWLSEPDVFGLSFEDLYGDPGRLDRVRRLEQLYRFLELPASKERPHEVADRLNGTATRTWSGARSSRHDYWNDAVDQVFGSLEGPGLNAAYGYGE